MKIFGLFNYGKFAKEYRINHFNCNLILQSAPLRFGLVPDDYSRLPASRPYSFLADSLLLISLATDSM